MNKLITIAKVEIQNTFRNTFTITYTKEECGAIILNNFQ